MNYKLYSLIHRECTYKHYYYQPLQNDSWLNRNIVFPVKLFVKRWCSAIYLPFNPKYNKQQFPGERKTKRKMLYESLLWTFKYKEVCTWYFLYGLDLKGNSPSNYVAYTEFRVLRNIINFRCRENMRSLYTFNYLALVRDKFVFYRYCNSLGMPYPETYAFVNNGMIAYFMDKSDDINFEPLRTLVEHDMDAFCKEVNGQAGYGAFALSVDRGKLYVNGELRDLDSVVGMFGNGIFVVQKKLKNNPEIEKIYSKSLNTLRLVTFLNEDGSVEFINAIMRFGAGGSIVDNACRGGVFVGVDKNGYLQDLGYREPGFNLSLVIDGVHPDTGVSFVGMRLPFWDDVIDAVSRFHKFFFGIPSLGWDIAFTPDGFVFTEAGEDWEINMSQATVGGLREIFYKYHAKALDVKLRNYI